MRRVLVVDDDVASCRTLQLHYEQRGFKVATALSAREGFGKLVADAADVVISDIRMPGQSGLEFLQEIRSRWPDLPVVMITAFQDLDSTVAAMQGGAVDYVPKPIDIDELDEAVDRALNIGSQVQSEGLVIDSGEPRGTIIGRSKAMQELFKSIGMVSQSRVTVLILGGSGTGKELTARAIHMAGSDRKAPFVAINCAALVETLLESELFGHEKGAFTGAVSARKGKVEQAGSGTLFLDEISELSLRLQGKLLRLLEEREFTPLGGNSTKHTNARFIAATNADLAQRVKDGEFREDLYYRLHVVNISLPLLRARRDDIRPLVEHLLKRINREVHKGIRRVSSQAMEALIAYDWPGNVRQLENTLVKAVVMAQGDRLTLADLPPAICQPVTDRNGSAGDGRPRQDARLSLKELERRHIKEVLQRTGWHKGEACKILGISRPRLQRRLREFNITEDD